MPLEEIRVLGDFTLTVSSPQNVWISSEITESSPLVFDASLVYHGDNPEAHAHHRFQFYNFGVKRSNGEGLFGNAIVDVTRHTTFQNGKPYTWKFKWYEWPIFIDEELGILMPIDVGNYYFVFGVELFFVSDLPNFEYLILLPFSIV